MSNGMHMTSFTRLGGHHSARRLLLASAVTLLLGACATLPGPLGTPSSITITDSGVDDPRDAVLCQSFKVDAQAMRSFLRHAVVITPRQEHDFFLHAPCYVRGTLTTRYETWHWELRNGGTARFTSAAGDDSFLLADPREESSLGDD